MPGGSDTTATEFDWMPDERTVRRSNLAAAMAECGVATYEAFHAWSASHRDAFWADAVSRVGIRFDREPDAVLDESAGPQRAEWLRGARLNIAESCFRHEPATTAIVAARGRAIRRVTRGELLGMVRTCAAGLASLGISRGDSVAIAMPMTIEAVVAYLGTVWIGATVVSIADSFAADEIATRLKITDTDLVVTQDTVGRGGKSLPMLAKVLDAGARRAVVVDTGSAAPMLRPGDTTWAELMAAGSAAGPHPPVACDPHAPTNHLFSSGTTGDPKAIPWTHITPIKCAVDGFYHADVHPSDVVAWPTNLGWMMGPWLIYASLINGAAMALYDDAPVGRPFGRFVRDAEVTILGVVPSLVAAWRSSQCMEGLDWSRVRLLTSTGEASNPSDMRYLMGLAGGSPVVEYCGGTEIGGSYITGTVVQPARASTFSTPALGLDIRILDDEGQPADSGEVFIVPPSIGLSTELLNRDHHLVYYEGVPRDGEVALRRHGDHMERLADGYYRALGRVDDTMNLGGIKVSSAEIERVLAGVDGVSESAAVAVPPRGGGPSRLVAFVVAVPGRAADPDALRKEMQAAIRAHLNPLFKIHEVRLVDALPRTASNKVMRRTLRDGYGEAP